MKNLIWAALIAYAAGILPARADQQQVGDYNDDSSFFSAMHDAYMNCVTNLTSNPTECAFDARNDNTGTSMSIGTAWNLGQGYRPEISFVTTMAPDGNFSTTFYSNGGAEVNHASGTNPQDWAAGGLAASGYYTGPSAPPSESQDSPAETPEAAPHAETELLPGPAFEEETF